MRSQRRILGWRARLGAAAAILVVAVAVPLLRTELRPVPDGQAPAPVENVEQLPVVAQRPEPFVTDIDFADRQHGFALRTYCYDVRTPCLIELLVTADGEHWRSRSLPQRKAEGNRTAIDRLWVLGPNEVVVAESFATARPGRWYSADAGQTWQPVPGTVEGSVEAVPVGGALDVVCQEPSGSALFCTRTTLVVTMPGSGRLAALGTQPGLNLKTPHGVPFAADGSHWVAGQDTGSGRWAVAVSRDSGRSWAVSELPEQPSRPVDRMEISVGPAGVYAAAIGELPGITNGLLAIFHSSDGGRGWRQTWQGFADREPNSSTGAAVATGDRRLIVNTESGPPYVSADDGETFAPSPADLAVKQVRWTRVGYLATVNAQSVAYLSEDGRRWRKLTVE